MRGIHSGKTKFGIPVNRGQYIPPLSINIPNHRIHTYQETGYRFPGEIGYLLSLHRTHSFLVNSGLFNGVVVDTTLLDNTLYFPTGHSIVCWKFFLVQLQQLQLAIADMRLP